MTALSYIIVGIICFVGGYITGHELSGAKDEKRRLGKT